jgi:hypothetical protein
MMLDQDLVAVYPATTYRILANAGLLKRWNDKKETSKGKGTTSKTSRALAHRYLVLKHLRDVLLLHRHPRRLQPLHR